MENPGNGIVLKALSNDPSGNGDCSLLLFKIGQVLKITMIIPCRATYP